MKSILTSAQRQYIKRNYTIESASSMGRRFGVSRSCVKRFMNLSGLILTQDDLFNIFANAQSTATQAEDNYIIKHYLRLPSKTIAANIGRSDTFVRTRLSVLQLVIPADIIQSRKIDSRYKPGSIPKNKGKKMSKAQYRKASSTMFKKGQKPLNLLYNGAITIRKDKRGVPQKFIRISKGKWDYLSRHNYRKHHGRIPPKHCVSFKDGDTLNCDPSNLQLISMADNARRNQYSKYPPEVREVIRLNYQLKKQIHAKKQNK